MLTVKRKPGEEIVIGEGPGAIRVRVARVYYAGGNYYVSLSVAAPRDVLILRAELEGTPRRPPPPEEH